MGAAHSHALEETGARAWVGAPRGPTSSELGLGAGLGAQPSPDSMPPSFSCILSQTLGMSESACMFYSFSSLILIERSRGI